MSEEARAVNAKVRVGDRPCIEMDCDAVVSTFVDRHGYLETVVRVTFDSPVHIDAGEKIVMQIGGEEVTPDAP